MLKFIPVHSNQVAELRDYCMLFSTMWDFYHLDQCLSPYVETIVKSSSQLFLILKCLFEGVDEHGVNGQIVP